MKSEKISQQLGQHRAVELYAFIRDYLESPITKDNIFYTFKSIEEIAVTVWGPDEDWILKQFQRFLNLRFYE